MKKYKAEYSRSKPKYSAASEIILANGIRHAYKLANEHATDIEMTLYSLKEKGTYEEK